MLAGRPCIDNPCPRQYIAVFRHHSATPLRSPALMPSFQYADRIRALPPYLFAQIDKVKEEV
ncbi:MAG: hypothetical protein LDL27_00570, partial [Desulfovibrio sp.]|nr:hypothetical protein [Desulfovibrio sp.]